MLRKLVGALVALAVLAGGLGAAADKADKGKADDKGDCQVAGVITLAPKTAKAPDGQYQFVVTDAKGKKHGLTCPTGCKVIGPLGGTHDGKWLVSFIAMSKTPVSVTASGKHSKDD